MDDEVELEGNHHNKVSLSRHLYVYDWTDYYYWCDWTGDSTVVSGNHVDKHFPRSLAILFIIPRILFFISKIPSMIVFFFSRAAIMSSLFDKRY